MKITFSLKNITIKQANILTVVVLLFLTIIFVGLLTQEMYKDYEHALEQSYISGAQEVSQSDILEQKHKKLKALTIKTVLVMVTLAFILFAIFLGLNNLFNRLLQRDIQAFLEFFERAAHNEQVINHRLIFFKDIKIMAGYANEMVQKISKQKYDLIDLNLGLEDRVKEKTKKLENEKIFSQELLKSQKEFLRYTVHETNTPLSVILTSIELYTMRHPKDRQLSKIESAVKNIFSIYDDLSYLVKKDQIEYPKVAINLSKYVVSRVDFFTEVAEHSHLSFEYRTKFKDSYIYFNETKLQRIVDNTITNAIKYTLANESIEIQLSQSGTYLEFLVASKSKIIKDTDKVFDEYYREGSRDDGFGIGLRLVRSICDEEGVDISVSSSDNKTVFLYKFKMMGE
ncbi:MAG: HAMP domain-containing sensor histidine kinase [Campylobacterota bacterium]|nr:HAMP domain-containing sensor histidine kinase [Campylobacterota bacterium]